MGRNERNALSFMANVNNINSSLQQFLSQNKLSVQDLRAQLAHFEQLELLGQQRDELLTRREGVLAQLAPLNEAQARLEEAITQEVLQLSELAKLLQLHFFPASSS